MTAPAPSGGNASTEHPSDVPIPSDADADVRAELEALEQRAAADDPAAWTALARHFAAPASPSRATTPRDAERALALFTRAAGQGYAPAQYELSVVYTTGTLAPADASAGARWLMAAGEAGYAPAEFAIARLYFESRPDRPARPGQALEWLRRAAHGGHAPAEYELGRRLAAGEGVRRDVREAREWLDRAAKQGIEEAKALRDGLESAP